jgi:LynF/TruF/PatF family peptide O-prenyltransferase
MKIECSNRSNSFEYYTKYLKNKKVFNIKDSVYLEVFENVFQKSKKLSMVEFSIKINGKKVYPIRFNIYYGRDKYTERIDIKEHIRSLNLILNFFNDLSKQNDVKLNYSILKVIFDNKFDLTKLIRPIVGIDLRNNIKKSRAKIWFIIKDYPEKVNQVLSIAGIKKKTSELMVDDKLLVGIDLYFNGKTKLKVYSLIYKEDINNLKFNKQIRNRFSNKIFDLIKQSEFFSVSFSENMDRIITIKIEDYSKIIKNASKTIHKIIEKIEKNKLDKYGLTLSFKENEFNDENMRNINIYY